MYRARQEVILLIASYSVISYVFIFAPIIGEWSIHFYYFSSVHIISRFVMPLEFHSGGPAEMFKNDIKTLTVELSGESVRIQSVILDIKQDIIAVFNHA